MESDSVVSLLHQGTQLQDAQLQGLDLQEPSLYKNDIVLRKISRKWKIIES